jgi:uncharacterized protein (TIGR02611 family)
LDETSSAASHDKIGKDWAWRRKIRSHRVLNLFYRIVVGVVGLLVLVLGLFLVPFPGPGWLIVLFGVAIWASEFAWAQRLLKRARHFLKVWTRWVQAQAWWVTVLALLGIAILVAALFYVLFLTSGVPGFLPNNVEQWLSKLPGLSS